MLFEESTYTLFYSRVTCTPRSVDKDWHFYEDAKVGRGKVAKVPSGRFCYQCGETATIGFPLMTLEEVESTLVASEPDGFSKTFKQADQVRRGVEAPDFYMQSSDRVQHAGMEISKTYLHLTVPEFTAIVGAGPKAVGALLDTIPDEEGTGEVTGVLFRDDGTVDVQHGHYRRVRMINFVGSRLLSHQNIGSKCIRKDQGLDAHNSQVKKLISQRAARLRRGTPTPPPNWSDLQKFIDEAKKLKTKQAEKEDQADEAAGGDVDVAMGEENDSDDEESGSSGEASGDEDEEGGQSSDFDMLTMTSKPQKALQTKRVVSDDEGQGKGRGRGKAKKAANGGRGLFAGRGRDMLNLSPAPPTGPPPPSAGRSASPANSTASVPVAAPAGSPAKLINNVQAYIAELSLASVLAKRSLGDKAYQASRTVKALRKQNLLDQALLLENHLEMINLATSCQADKIADMKKSIRQAKFKKLVSAGVPMPPQVRAAITVQACKEAEVWSVSEGTQAFFDIVNPFARGEFDPLEPRLFLVGLSGSELAQTLHQIFVNDGILVALNMGQQAHLLLRAFLGKFATVFKNFDASSLPPLVAATLEDLIDVFSMLYLVVDPAPPSDTSLLERAKEILDEEPLPNQSAQLKVIKLALHKDKFFKQLCMDTVKTVRDAKTFGASIAAATCTMRTALSGEANQEYEIAITDLFSNFSVWKAKLRAGAMDELEQLMTRYLQEQAEKLNRMEPTVECLAFAKVVCKRFDSFILAMGPTCDLVRLHHATNAKVAKFSNLMQGTVLKNACTAFCSSRTAQDVATLRRVVEECSGMDLEDEASRALKGVLEVCLNVLSAVLVDHTSDDFQNEVQFRKSVADMAIETHASFPAAFHTRAEIPMKFARTFLEIAELLPELELKEVSDICSFHEKMFQVGQLHTDYMPRPDEMRTDMPPRADMQRILACYTKVEGLASEHLRVAARQCLEDSAAALEPLIEALDAIADGGTETGESWKASLDNKSSFKKVADVATEKLTQETGKNITNAINVLKKVRVARQSDGLQPRRTGPKILF